MIVSIREALMSWSASARASLGECTQQIHVLAEALRQAPGFSYGVADQKRTVCRGTRDLCTP